MKLLRFEYDIIYYLGKDNRVANALSCREDSQMMWIVYYPDKTEFDTLNGVE